MWMRVGSAAALMLLLAACGGESSPATETAPPVEEPAEFRPPDDWCGTPGMWGPGFGQISDAETTIEKLPGALRVFRERNYSWVVLRDPTGRIHTLTIEEFAKRLDDESSLQGWILETSATRRKNERKSR